MVGDDVLGDTMQLDHMGGEEVRRFGRIQEYGEGNEVDLFGRPVDHGQDVLLPLELGDR